MQPYTRAMGVIGYNEICELHKDWPYVWDDEQQVPHIVQGNQWFGFDDPKSIGLKVGVRWVWLSEFIKFWL